MDSHVFSEDFSVTLGSISQLSGENNQYAAEVVTESGRTYKTGVLSEFEFRCLVAQKWQDRIRELRIMRGNEKEFLSSELVSEEMKTRLQKLLGGNF